MKRRKWSKKKIISQIRRLKRDGENLSASVVSREHIALFSAASSASYFGSWRSAVCAAGINYERIMSNGKKSRRQKLSLWDKKRVLLEIGRSSTESLVEAYRHNLALYSAGRREFGSWEKALKMGGYRLKKSGRKNSNLIVKRRN